MFFSRNCDGIRDAALQFAFIWNDTYEGENDMRKHKKEEVSTKAKVCTVISGALVLLVVAFSVYAEMPTCATESIHNPLWGVLCLIITFFAGYILLWGYRSSK